MLHDKGLRECEDGLADESGSGQRNDGAPYQPVLDFGREQMTKAEFDNVVGLFRLLHELRERIAR